MGMKTGNFNNILEERQFSNPDIRFRRIRGRIVPIVNKHKIGGRLERAGDKLSAAGAAGIGIFAGKKIASKKFPAKTKKIGSLFKSASRYSSSLLAPTVSKAIPDSFKRTRTARVSKAVGRVAAKSGRFALRNPGKIGAALSVAGIVAKGIGTELRLESRFGKDISF